MNLETQMKPKLQRAFGRIEIEYLYSHELNCLVHLHQAGCLKAMIPKNYCKIPDIVLINTSGGITGGDYLRIIINVGEMSHVCLTTQTAERLYRCNGGHGSMEVSIKLENQARLDWLPQETIVFNKSAFKRLIRIDMEASSHLLMVDSVILGRKAMGETVTENIFEDKWNIYRGNKPVFVEALTLSNAEKLTGLASLGENTSLATILFISPQAEGQLNRMRHILDSYNIFGAVSAWDGKLVVRLVSEFPRQLKSTLINILTDFQEKELPKVWTV